MPDLAYALEHSFKTVAKVKSTAQSNAIVERATRYWLDLYKCGEWHLITIDLTLLTNQLDSASPSIITRKEHGILRPDLFRGYSRPNTIWIYSTDRYTEQWVHDLVLRCAPRHETGRVLNIVRDDPGEAIDLGEFKLR